MPKDYLAWLTATPSSDIGFKSALADAPMEILNEALDERARQKTGKTAFNAIRSEIHRRYKESDFSGERIAEFDAYVEALPPRQSPAIPLSEQSDPKSETAVATGNLLAEVAELADAPDTGTATAGKGDHPEAAMALQVQILPSAPVTGRPVTLDVLDTLPPLQPETPEEAERQMAQQLTAQYKLAVGGMRDVLIFGAMMIRLEQTVSARGHGGKFGEKGGGLKGWLEQNTPEVNRATAYRLKSVTESVAEEYEKIVGAKTAKQYALSDLVVTPAHELPEAVRAKQDQLFAYVEGTSQRSWLDKLKPAKSRGGNQDPDEDRKPLTQAEEHARFLEHARETFITALKAPDDLLHHGFFKAPSITDAEREAAATLYESFAKELRAFNAIPQKRRTIAAPEAAE